VGVKETPDMRAKIAAAAGDEDLHNSIKGDIYLDSKRFKSIESEWRAAVSARPFRSHFRPSRCPKHRS
ncbi:MAG TPA: hypothetical protein VGO43_15030, partial [Pyrinomonadaceae bacterium]|nr:hypothetical protein [Pyrinomonadaceae bacterium]